MKKVISFLLCVLMLLSAFSVYAEDDYSIMPLFQTDISEVESEIKGGTNYLSDSFLGTITREKVVAELTEHQNDGYYIGTPYHRSDWQSPYGDPIYNGSVSMNCCGFVCYVLRKCGFNGEAAIEYIKRSSSHATATGSLPYDLISKASNYYELVREADLVAYAFESKSEMLSSGKCAKGDIILMYVNSPYGLDYGEDNHIGFFWGDTSSDDKFWHSTTNNAKGNDITKITESTAVYLLIKLDASNEAPKFDGEFTEYITNMEVNLRSGAGTTYDVITKIPKDTKVKLIEKYNLFWYKVEVNGTVGYISTAYLIPTATIVEPEVTPAPTPTPTPVPSPPEYEDEFAGITTGTVPMFRLYNVNSGEHFYTGSKNERDYLSSLGWNYEGVGFNFPVTGKPVYRLYEPITGEHLYTMDEAEKEKLLSENWNYEGVAFNSAGEDEIPQYRLHNPNASCGAYHFTGSEEERDILIAEGWEYQGIGFYSSLE